MKDTYQIWQISRGKTNESEELPGNKKHKANTGKEHTWIIYFFLISDTSFQHHPLLQYPLVSPSSLTLNAWS